METDVLVQQITALEEKVNALQERVENMEHVGAILAYIREKKARAREQKNDFLTLKSEDILQAFEGCKEEVATWAMELAIQPGDEKNTQTGAVLYYLKPKRR